MDDIRKFPVSIKHRYLMGQNAVRRNLKKMLFHIFTGANNVSGDMRTDDTEQTQKIIFS